MTLEIPDFRAYWTRLSGAAPGGILTRLNAGVPLWGRGMLATYSAMTITVLQYVLAAMALACLVASDVLSWGLSTYVVGLLGAVVGWVAKRPSDLLPPKE